MSPPNVIAIRDQRDAVIAEIEALRASRWYWGRSRARRQAQARYDEIDARLMDLLSTLSAEAWDRPD